MKSGCFPKLLAILTQFSTTWPSLIHYLNNHYQATISVESDETIHKQSPTTEKI